MLMSTNPSEIPMANSPLLVSKEIAVVMVRVNHLMLPPIIMAMPTSAITRPYAATATAIYGRRIGGHVCSGGVG